MSQNEKPKVALDNGCPCCGAEVTDFTRENEETYESRTYECGAEIVKYKWGWGVDEECGKTPSPLKIALKALNHGE